jgi:N-acyl-L-homoserine lactone synthetase
MSRSFAVADAVSAVSYEFMPTLADTPALLEECYRIRYEVYCSERHFLVGQNGVERDEFDANSQHIALLSRRTGSVVGTVRLVFPAAGTSTGSLPLQRVCGPSLPQDMPLGATAEISRFAIAKQRRGLHATAMMRFGLFRGIVEASSKLDITHWCAVMEPSLLRLLATSSIRFNPIGLPVDYHGLRQPCYNSIAAVMDGIYFGRLAIWNYVTNFGDYWPPPNDAMCADIWRPSGGHQRKDVGRVRRGA